MSKPRCGWLEVTLKRGVQDTRRRREAEACRVALMAMTKSQCNARCHCVFRSARPRLWPTRTTPATPREGREYEIQGIVAMFLRPTTISGTKRELIADPHQLPDRQIVLDISGMLFWIPHSTNTSSLLLTRGSSLIRRYRCLVKGDRGPADAANRGQACFLGRQFHATSMAKHVGLHVA